MIEVGQGGTASVAVGRLQGETPAAHVRRTLKVAAEIERTYRLGRVGPRSPGGPSWGRLVQPEWWQVYGREAAREVTVPPTPGQVQLWEETLGWWQALAGEELQHERLAVRLRAAGATWERVAAELGCGRTRAIRVESQGVALIVAWLSRGA